MKIIGTTTSGFLIECADDELCNLMGIDRTNLANEGYNRIDEKSPALEVFKKSKGSQYCISKKVDWVGLSIPVSQIYQSARKVSEGWDKHYSLNEAIKTARAFADSLEMIKGTYMPLKVEEQP